MQDRIRAYLSGRPVGAAYGPGAVQMFHVEHYRRAEGRVARMSKYGPRWAYVLCILHKKEGPGACDTVQGPALIYSGAPAGKEISRGA